MSGMSETLTGIWKWRWRKEGQHRVDTLVMSSGLSSIRKELLRRGLYNRVLFSKAELDT